VRYSHVFLSRFYEPGARLAIARPTTPSKPIRPQESARVSLSASCLNMIPMQTPGQIWRAAGGAGPERLCARVVRSLQEVCR